MNIHLKAIENMLPRANTPKPGSLCLVELRHKTHVLHSVLDLVLRNAYSRNKMHHDVYYFNQCEAHKKSYPVGKKSIKLISSCLLNHRFHEAAKLLWVLCQDRRAFDLFFYKAMMVVFENLKPDEITMLEFSRNIQDQRFLNKQDTRLEYVIYALKYHLPTFSKNLQKVYPKNIRHMLKKMSPHDALQFGYYTLRDYMSWQACCKDGLLAFQEENAAKTAINNLKKVLEYPGTWDIFVLKLIEMLNYYRRHDEVVDVLKQYVALNPEHTNAYIYLCVYLYKYEMNDKIFVRYSKELVKLCPSDERVLLLVQKWVKEGKYFKKRLRILFMFLDYPANGRNTLAWKMLASHITEAFGRSKSSSINAVRSLWNERRNSWNCMYFNPLNTAQEELELLMVRVNALSIIQSDHQYVTEAIHKNPILQHTKIVMPSKEDFDVLCTLDCGMNIG